MCELLMYQEVTYRNIEILESQAEVYRLQYTGTWDITAELTDGTNRNCT